VLVLSCFGTTLTHCSYMPFTALTLLVEYHSILLHVRRIWLWCVDSVGPLYSVFRVVHYLSIVVFRLVLHPWLTYLLWHSYHLFSIKWVWCLATFSLVALSVINVFLFLGIYKGDRSWFAKIGSHKSKRMKKQQ
jgi:hypothetical protein